MLQSDTTGTHYTDMDNCNKTVLIIHSDSLPPRCNLTTGTHYTDMDNCNKTVLIIHSVSLPPCHSLAQQEHTILTGIIVTRLH